MHTYFSVLHQGLTSLMLHTTVFCPYTNQCNKVLWYLHKRQNVSYMHADVHFAKATHLPTSDSKQFSTFLILCRTLTIHLANGLFCIIVMG